MIIRSKIDGNGREAMSICVRCSLDSRNICNGIKIVLENDHKHNSYLIYKSNDPIGCYKELQKGKEGTLELTEFEKWLSEHNYKEDDRACKEFRDKKLLDK